MWQAKLNIEYTIHCGKTNSGKTYQSIQRLKEIGQGVYLAPLRLLAWEIFDKLNENDFVCNLVTGEEQITSPHAKMTASTIEMLNSNQFHECVVIDEAFMLSDKDRGKAWLNAILNVKAKEVHIITNPEALDLIKGILECCDRTFTVKNYEMLQPFKFAEFSFEMRGKGKLQPQGVFVSFSRKGVLYNKRKFENMGNTVSILYGNLPPEVKKQQIADFISGKSDVLVTTDVIGMGINVPCNYLVFLEVEKFDGTQVRRLNSIEVKQISGRCGRYGLNDGSPTVNAMDKGSLRYIKEQYGLNTVIKKAYFGLDFNIFNSLPAETSVRDRINYFKETDFIPDNIKHLVYKESVKKYFEIAEVVDKKQFDVKEKWDFLTAPVKYNNMQYFSSAIYGYTQTKLLRKPDLLKITQSDAKTIEDNISEIELYLNLTRHFIFNIGDKKLCQNHKEKLIDRLSEVIADKKLIGKKKCKTCDTMLSVDSHYNYCNPCFRKNFSYDDDYSFFRHS